MSTWRTLTEYDEVLTELVSAVKKHLLNLVDAGEDIDENGEEFADIKRMGTALLKAERLLKGRKNESIPNRS